MLILILTLGQFIRGSIKHTPKHTSYNSYKHTIVRHPGPGTFKKIHTHVDMTRYSSPRPVVFGFHAFFNLYPMDPHTEPGRYGFRRKTREM